MFQSRTSIIESARHIRVSMIFNGYQRFCVPFNCIPPAQKGKEVMKGMLHSSVVVAEKEILSGA